jgi:glycosyltransferase involved in cell wall biosynthesis
MTTGSVRSVRVTFGIPAFNSPYLEQAIRSVLAQTLSDIELVVCDDAPAPGAEPLVAGLGDPRVRYYRNGAAPGVPANWNRCLQQASGTYFVLLPHDDMVAPEFASRMVAALEGRPAAGFAQCSLLSIDDVGRPIDIPPARPPAEFLSGCEALAWQLATLRCNPVALMFRRDVLVRFGGWQEHFWDDWAVILRIAFRHGFVFVREPVAMNRTHDRNLSIVMWREGRDEVLDLINQQAAVFGDALPATPELLALRARCNRELSHRAMIKVVKALSRMDLKGVAFHYRRARYLYPLAGLHPGFLGVAYRNRVEMRRRQPQGR